MQRLVPFNSSVGLDRGMNFIIKTTQLSIETVITQPQEQPPLQLPNYAAFFADTKNMFNCISQEALVETISKIFPDYFPWHTYSMGTQALSAIIGKMSHGGRFSCWQG